ncbi:YktB family protein [Evansella sp. AB-rgal1]|uniref:YktB family protein n=1 Tax=Evansella sp. AB-rgal1 TaxID=3242696 RepID=UPI00359E4886
MNFDGFQKEDFEVFYLEGLDERMAAIQEKIQPKFKEIGESVAEDLSSYVNNEMFLHIAKHARRSVNPPKDTWMALCHNKRGYKKHPHFQVGLFDDHVFIWLAYIYELPNKTDIAQRFLDDMDSIRSNVPSDYVISLDHMKKDAESLESIDLHHSLQRFRDVKKAEFLIGRHVKANDPILEDGEKLIEFIKQTFKTLSPLYKISMR